MPMETAAAISCLLMGNVLERFPRLKFCFAHGGGSFPWTLGRIQHGYDVRPDLCATRCQKPPKDFVGRFFTDSLVHDPLALQFLVRVIGEDRVILGTDYPFPLGELEPGRLIQSMDWAPPLKEKLLWENGLEFLGLDSSLFK
ncbi:unnamed protein product [Darwinula stevensoni]|uniref:2-amino-3-carboxymuconate-6-semialdehyde decarboxylase n=1 Tax=Darwinula stevensoni TaxID=69355 RepID=A0A7R8XF01_9CRUS|nr:unnamed protein product [Darwinula stevensoni]CAG0890201.1 unnamed protein product [Darwinula stevensoni]